MPPISTCLYLHGFASSPGSSKARFLATRLAGRGQVLHCPDLNEPGFSTLTVTRMIERGMREIQDRPPGPVALVGSSLGAFVALHLADRMGRGATGDAARHPITRLVLLAPALDFGPGLARRLGPEAMQAWRDTDRLEVFHHADGVTRTVGYALHADAIGYDSRSTRVTAPILIFQGRHDLVVDPAGVEAFARGRPGVMLRLLDDDHQLHASLERIWNEMAPFLGLDP